MSGPASAVSPPANDDDRGMTANLVQLLRQAGVPEPRVQASFVELVRELKALQGLVGSCTMLREGNHGPALEAVTAATRPRIENVIRLGRQLVDHHSSDGRLPVIVVEALDDADRTLTAFLQACLPARVLH